MIDINHVAAIIFALRSPLTSARLTHDVIYYEILART